MENTAIFNKNKLFNETYMYIPVEEYERLVREEALLNVIMASRSKEGFVNTEVIKAVQKILEVKETDGGQKC